MIDSAASSLLALPTAQNQTAANGSARGVDRQAEDFYATLLGQFDKEGFASATPVPDESLNDQSVRTTWNDWFDQLGITQYTFQAGAGSPSVRKNKTAADLRQDYGNILVDAYQKGGYASPQQYLRSLDRDQLSAIQQVHHLADPIDPQQLSPEASLNLILPPPAQVDENNDGLTAVGAAYTLRFPSSDTPSEVRDAWDAATADLSDEDKMFYSLQMSMPLITANLHFDEDGRFIRASQPGDSDWVNPMAAKNFSYKQFANDWLQYLKDFESQMPPEQVHRDQKFWTAFRDYLV